MGEYILLDGARTKLGTCEDLLYTTYEQLAEVVALGLTEHLGDLQTGAIALPIADPTSIIIGSATYGPRDLTPTGQPAAMLITTWALQFIAPLPAEVRELLLRGDYLAAARAAPHALLQIGAPCETYNPVTRRWEAGWRLVGFEGEHFRVQQDGEAIGYYVRWREYVRPPTPSWVPIDEEAPDAA